MEGEAEEEGESIEAGEPRVQGRVKMEAQETREGRKAELVHSSRGVELGDWGGQNPLPQDPTLHTSPTI